MAMIPHPARSRWLACLLLIVVFCAADSLSGQMPLGRIPPDYEPPSILADFLSRNPGAPQKLKPLGELTSRDGKSKAVFAAVVAWRSDQLEDKKKGIRVMMDNGTRRVIVYLDDEKVAEDGIDHLRDFQREVEWFEKQWPRTGKSDPRLPDHQDPNTINEGSGASIGYENRIDPSQEEFVPAITVLNVGWIIIRGTPALKFDCQSRGGFQIYFPGASVADFGEIIRRGREFLDSK